MAPLEVQPFVDRAPILHDVGETLVGAKIRGAKIPWALLINILETINSGDLWGGFTFSGIEEAKWVLKNHPEHILSVAQAALNLIPENAIPLLLMRAKGDERPLHSTPDHPLRVN